MRDALRAEFRSAPSGVSVRTSSTAALELRGPFPGLASPHPPRYFLRNVTAGMLDGDEYEVTIHAAERARVSVTPTSAAKVFVTRGSGASLATHLEGRGGALLDYDAGLTIPHAGAVASQATRIVLHEGARVVYADTLAFGRLARGERFAFARLEAAVRVETPSGVALFARRSVLDPSRHRVRLETAVGDAGVLASMLLLGGNEPPEPPGVDGVYVGVSALPHGIGWQVQVLAARPEQAERLLSTLRDAFLAGSALPRTEASAQAGEGVPEAISR